MSEINVASLHGPPDDLETFSREMLIALVREVFTHVDELRGANAKLRHENDQLLRKVFGKRSEKVTGMPQGTDAQAPAAEETRRPRKPRRKASPHGRQHLPKHLPRVRVVHDVPEADRTCLGCQKPMEKIGEEVTEQLDVIPATFRVLQHVREKYACRCGEGKVVTASLPPQAVERSLATPDLLAQVVTSKFADHLPLNRQASIFLRQGVRLGRSTLCDWVGDVTSAVEPLYDCMKMNLLASGYIRADDTRIQYLDPTVDHTKRGHLWAYVGDEAHRHVVFEFSPNWENIWPLRFLESFEGWLQADAYKGWDAVFERKPDLVIEIACMAHARRKWFEAKLTDPTRALTAITFIRKLYDVEEVARGMDPKAREHLRRREAALTLDAMRAWMDSIVGSFLPKSPIGQAWTYMDNQWSALVRYIEHGELEIDNNAAERALRPIAVGRANWLFAGNEEGGRRAAILYSFVESCKRNGIDPLAYFRDVLARIATHPQHDLSSLLPASWTPQTAQAPNDLTSTQESAAA